MPANEGVFLVPDMSADRRIRVYRRRLNASAQFEGIEVDAYIVITDSHLLVCDTLLCPEDVALMLQDVRDELADRSLIVVNSHADWDHAWGNAYFTGALAAPIIAHEYARVRMQAAGARQELAEFQRLQPVFRSVELVQAGITFKDTLTIHDEALTLELFAAPGHQRDHIAAWLPQLRLLLAFDAVEAPLPGIENAAAVPAMIATLERLQALQPVRVLCSHGGTTHPRTIAQNLAYMREVERRSRAALVLRPPTPQELANAAEFIGYPFDEIVASSHEEVDRAFYSQTHTTNVRSMLEWLQSMAGGQ